MLEQGNSAVFTQGVRKYFLKILNDYIFSFKI